MLKFRLKDSTKRKSMSGLKPLAGTCLQVSNGQFRTGGSWESFWSDEEKNLTAYYVHGKDNIPFHTLIWPALLLGVGGLHLPDRILSCEYMTLEGKKFSTSHNWAVWVPDFLKRYNGDLLGAFGNFVNRTSAFIDKSFGGCVPSGVLSEGWKRATENTYRDSGALIEEGRLKEAIELIFTYVRQANKYFDEQKPWVQIKENREACEVTLNSCVQIIANLANLLQPFIPFTCEKIRTFLTLERPNWQLTFVRAH